MGTQLAANHANMTGTAGEGRGRRSSDVLANVRRRWYRAAIPNPIPGGLILSAKPARWDPLKAHGRSGMADDDRIENAEPPLSREKNAVRWAAGPADRQFDAGHPRRRQRLRHYRTGDRAALSDQRLSRIPRGGSALVQVRHAGHYLDQLSRHLMAWSLPFLQQPGRGLQPRGGAVS
jgi:hypothetical protein